MYTLLIAAALYVPPMLFAFGVITLPYLIITFVAAWLHAIKANADLSGIDDYRELEEQEFMKSESSIKILMLGILAKVAVVFAVMYSLAYLVYG